MVKTPENIILFGDDTWFHLLPLTFTKPIGELRIGIMTIREKWAYELHSQISYITQDYLAEKYPLTIAKDNLLINSAFLPEPVLLGYIRQLEPNHAIFWENDLIAAHMSEEQIMNLEGDKVAWQHLKGTDISSIPSATLSRIKRPYDLIAVNGEELKRDFKRITEGRKSAPISDSNTLSGSYPVFAEEGAIMESSIVNTNNGPVYLGKDSLVMEGSLIRGSLAMNENAVLKMGAKVYGPTTIGPGSKIGGEVNNIIIQGNTNKGHDGYLGNSIIGEWCNLGAGTSASNLKNDYSEVKMWSYPEKKFLPTGRLFCGIVMGDHSRTAINTMLNTGTVIGVGCNIYGTGFPRQYIPCFKKGGASGLYVSTFKEVVQTTDRMMDRRQLSLAKTDENILDHIYRHHEDMTP